MPGRTITSKSVSGEEEEDLVMPKLQVIQSDQLGIMHSQKWQKNKKVFSTFLPMKCSQNPVDCSNCYSVFYYIYCYISSSILQFFSNILEIF